MNEIIEGQNYKAKRAGYKLDGAKPWAYIGTTDEKGKNDITVWLKTPTETRKDCVYKITHIYSSKLGQKRGTDGVWRSQASATCDVELIESEIDATFTDVTDAFGDVSFDEAVNSDWELPL